MTATSTQRADRLALLALAMATVASLSACGGGGGSSPPPAPAPAPAPTPLTVTSTNVTTSTAGGLAVLTVIGTGLDSTLDVTSSTCTNIVRSAASTSTTALYQCTTTDYTGSIVVSSATGTALSTATFAMPAPSVTGTSVSATRYGAPVLLTLTGTNLDAGISVTAPGCKGVTLSTAAPNASSATTAYYACTASGAFNSSFTVKGAFGEALGSATLTVPVPIVTMAVSGDGVSGNLVFTLRGDKAPTTVDNFLAYVNSGFYAGTIFHRVVPNFVVQAGGYTSATSGTLGTPKTATYAPIPLEVTGGSNLQWTAAMARTSVPASATSQFFINLVDNSSFLDSSATSAGYAVFGDVTASASLVQAIVAAPHCTALTGISDGSCVPIPNIVITSATQTQ
jgi:cyclophilin family peptidyl-prolyl cis-trans isomerase